MEVSVKPGKYVIAVSGGIDSMVLLNLLSRTKELELIVAHFDHGIREESAVDAKFVEMSAEYLGLEFEMSREELGKNASEDLARKRRYEFLQNTQKKYGATAIITAHHQDDAIETMIINLLRGTNRKGLSALKSTNAIRRPLIGYTKREIEQYALENNVSWREDSTNQSDAYLRNFVRNNIVSRFSEPTRVYWIKTYLKMLNLNEHIDQEIADIMQNVDVINRTWLIQFPNNISCELIAAQLRKYDVLLSQKQVQDTVIFCKVAVVGSEKVLSKTVKLLANKTSVSVKQQ